MGIATESVTTPTKRLTKQDLIDHLASGCKPKDKWRIGTEHEKFGINLDTLEPITYEQLVELMSKLADRYEWTKVMEGDRLIGLKANGANISLEPGGQFELSGAPLPTVHDTAAEVTRHLDQVKAVGKEMNIGFVGLGFNPKHHLEEIPIVPKERYHAMKEHLEGAGSTGLDVMYRTCTIQVNLDFESEEDMVDKLRVSLALQPVATAMFANSPFTDGKPNGHVSYRSILWEHIDRERTGLLPFVFEPGFGFEQYVDYALDVPLMFVLRNGEHIKASGLSFRDFLDGKLPVLPGEMPTLNDWENHLGEILPEVRLKKFLEMRGADCGPQWQINAITAFWVGILYDRQSLQGAMNLVSDWTEEERGMLRQQAPVQGLRVPFRQGTMHDVAKEVFKLAKEGLERRGLKEAVYLADLEPIVESGVTQAERWLELYNTKWGGSVDPLYREVLY